MARAKTHKDVEYSVNDASGRERIFKTPDEATVFAVSLALSDGGPHNIDVLVHSVKGAYWYRGSTDGEDEYEEDPEASVFERIVIRADSQGRIA
jgi:hypothetical protein